MKKIFKRTLCTLIATLLILTSGVTAFAEVDLAGGIDLVTQEVTAQVKTIIGIIFGFVALAALAFTVAKGVHALLEHNAGRPSSPTPVILGGIATIVCGLASTSLFLGWFGL